MDIIKHNLDNLVNDLKRLEKLALALPHNKKMYEQIQLNEIDRFVKDSNNIIYKIKHPQFNSFSF